MDLQLVETSSGGDLMMLGQDLAQVEGFENFPYIGLFGGNVEQSTPQTRNTGEQAFDWWGNSLLMPNLPTQQFNSQTERVLNSVSLTSGNLHIIQNAVNADIEFMKDFAEITIDVAIIGLNKVRIQLFVKKPENLNSTAFVYIWDGTIGDLQGSSTYFAPPVIAQQDGLEYVLGLKL